MTKSVKIVEKSKIFFIISAVIIIAGIVLLFIPGMNLGLDFTEGATIQVNMNFAAEDSEANAYCENIKNFIEADNTEGKFSVESTRTTKSSDGKLILQFNLNYLYNGESLPSGEFADKLGDEKNGLIAAILTHINENEGDFIKHEAPEGKFVNEDNSGITYSLTSPDATKSLTTKALIAIVVAIAAMLVYIAIRFKFVSGVAAVIVLIHDVMVMLTLTTAFQIKVNTTFIAAVITVIGYSINATIIVFDRIKENLQKYEGAGMSDAEIANMSIAQTLRRTIFTTVTTLVMIVLVAILGVDTIREFALPIIFGLLSGVYSAIILSSCIWVQIRKIAKKANKKGKKEGYQKYAKEKKIEA